MRILCKVGILFLALAGLALAETYTGVLIDAACAAQEKNAPCSPTASTTAFALLVAGQAKPQTLKLDPAGNQKAAALLKAEGNSADRAANPNHPATGSIIATVIGTRNGDELKVNAIQVD